MARHTSALVDLFARFRCGPLASCTGSSMASSSAIPHSPPGPPPQRGVVVHHFPAPGCFSSLPSRARFCASVAIKPVSLSKSIISKGPSPSSWLGPRNRVWSLQETASNGPSRMPLLAFRASFGVRYTDAIWGRGKVTPWSCSFGWMVACSNLQLNAHANISTNAETMSSRYLRGLQCVLESASPLLEAA